VETPPLKVLVAMSGGVDSSVSAYLLKKKGFDVAGLSLRLWDSRDVVKHDVCCSLETIGIAREVANRLDIQHFTVDVREAFHRNVIEKFCDSYTVGSTPNPCILCNKYIKFDFLLNKAEEIGADLIATGHYARVEKPGSSSWAGADAERFLLKSGVDSRKDQSYVLYVMTQEQLSRAIFPLGDMWKEDTRRTAQELGLDNALRAESQEICFVGDGNYIDFIATSDPGVSQPGPVVNREGEKIGTHKGIAFYTVGQRRRLDVQSLKPLYVISIDRSRNTIVVGDREDVMKRRVKVGAVNWIAFRKLARPIRARVKLRSTMEGQPALVTPEENCVIVEFDDLQWAPAPGQSAVFYHEDIVIGGGVIEKEG
jgi:tRNA-specific 2-thiouridylase